MRKQNLSMAWIDYEKAYDMVPHSWIIDSLETVETNEKIGRLGEMKSWPVELISEEDLAEVNIRQGIFQDNTLSPLLFVVCLLQLTHILRDAAPGYHFASNRQKVYHLIFMDDLKLYASNEKSLIQTVRVFSNDIGMEFGVNKCAVLPLKKEKMANSDGITLLNKTTMKGLKEGDSYKYVGVIQADGMKHHEMKEKVKTEYYRRVRKILETKLNGGNTITGINTWAISLLRYSAAFLDWTGPKLEQMDRRTRKLMTMHQALNPKTDIARIYLSRKEGGRGLISVEDIVKLAILGLERYVLTSEEGLLLAARRVDGDYAQHLGFIESVKESKVRRRNEQSNVLKQKKLHGQLFNEIKDVAGEEKWLWLTDGSIKRETESLIMAAEEQAIRTNVIKAKIDKTQAKSKCRLYGKVDETVRHIVCECPLLAQREYKKRNDWVGRKIHWDVCRKIGFDVNEKWYKHEPEKVVENDSWKILWDFTIQTDHIIEARRLDMVIIDKTKNECKIIDFVCPFDSRIEEREKDKMKGYNNLKGELKKIWDMPAKVIPVIVGALGTTPKKLKQRLGDTGIETRIVELQKTTILHSARILRNFRSLIDTESQEI